MGTILKCDRPNEARCCSISFDPSDSSVTFKDTTQSESAPTVALERKFDGNDELTTRSNEVESRTDISIEFNVATESILSNEIDTTPSNNDEQPTAMAVAREIRINEADVEEQQRRNEIHRIYADKEFNGTNPSYLQIINNSPTLLVYATHGDGMPADVIESTERPDQDETGSTEIDTNEIEMGTQNPSIENRTEMNADEFVSTKEHDNLTDVHHGIKRNSNYFDQNGSHEMIRTPEYFERVGKLDESQSEPTESDEREVKHKAQLMAVHSMLAKAQRESGPVRKPIYNRFSTLEEMVDSSKKQNSPVLGQARARNIYSFRAGTTTTTTTTTTEATQKAPKHGDRKTRRKYLQRQLPTESQSSAVLNSKIMSTTTTVPPPFENEYSVQRTQNLYSRNRMRTKPTKKAAEYESSSPSTVAREPEPIAKPADETRDNEPEFQMALLKRSQLFSSRRRNILDKPVTSSPPAADSEAPLTTVTTIMTNDPPNSRPEINSSTEASSDEIPTTRKPNRKIQHRFRARPKSDE